jgi:protoporphyrinogen oxidase
MTPDQRLIIIGAGPSGMAAAFEAVRQGAKPIVLERLDRVGGLARTIEHGGERFDIGPHRFFTLNDEVKQLFIDVCGSDLVHVSRLTRIYYRRKYFNYPLTPLNALFGMGVLSSIGIVASYGLARLRRILAHPPIVSFASAAAFSTPSLRPIRRRCGASRASASGPIGQDSASRD